MPSYKLTYFNARGRAEVARYMFKLKDVEFEDKRIEGNWQEVKPTTLFGQIPELETDGLRICQSSAIERLIARRLGLYGSNEAEQAKSDMITGCAEDILQATFKCTQGSDEEKAEKKKKLCEEQLPLWLSSLEKQLTSSGLFIGPKIMWADICVAHILSFLDVLKIEFDLSKYTKITALKNKVESEPKIAAWIKSRPESTF